MQFSQKSKYLLNHKKEQFEQLNTIKKEITNKIISFTGI